MVSTDGSPIDSSVLVLFILMETSVARFPLSDLRIVGGNLALDFANTRGGPRHGPATTEWLSSYEDFAAWSIRPASPISALRLTRTHRAQPRSQRSRGCRLAGTTYMRYSVRSPTAQRRPPLP